MTDVDADEMLKALRASPLLDGYRGVPPGDRQALISIILKVSALIDVVPALAELDLNPIKVLAPGKGAIVVDARMLLKPLRAAKSIAPPLRSVHCAPYCATR